MDHLNSFSTEWFTETVFSEWNADKLEADKFACFIAIYELNWIDNLLYLSDHESSMGCHTFSSVWSPHCKILLFTVMKIQRIYSHFNRDYDFFPPFELFCVSLDLFPKLNQSVWSMLFLLHKTLLLLKMCASLILYFIFYMNWFFFLSLMKIWIDSRCA